MTVPRWWRIGVLYEKDGDPWTWTFHVRAQTEKRACRLVDEKVSERPYAVFACHPSEPLTKVDRKEEVAADYGPYRRNWSDPSISDLRNLL